MHADLLMKLTAEQAEVVRLTAHGEDLVALREQTKDQLQAELAKLAEDKAAREQALQEEALALEEAGRRKAGAMEPHRHIPLPAPPCTLH